MNKKKRSYFFIACTVIGIGLVLWMESGKNFTRPERENASTSPEPVNDGTDFSIQIPDSWKEEIDSNNRIDAAITVPDSLSKDGFLSASAEIKSVDCEGVLLALEEYYHPQKGIEDEQVLQYTGEDDMYLYFFKQSGGVSLVSAFRNYVFMAYHEELAEDYNRDQYPVDQDLENFTVDECDERLISFCNSMGIEGDLDIVHRSLDYRIMEREAWELHSDGTEARPDYQWTSDDNSYYCTISQTCNGIPVIQGIYLQAYADILNRGGHTCLLNKERLVSFYISDIYDIHYHENHEKLLEFPDILERYRQYVNIARQDYETVVTDITMRAIVVNQGEGNYQVMPIWIFYGYWRSREDDVTGPHAVYINAVTGERL